MRVVVAGGGMAGVRLAEEIWERDRGRRVSVTIVGDEPRPPYNRILLSNLLAGETTAEDIVTSDAEWFAKRGYSLRAGCTVTAIDRDARRVRLSDGSLLAYDALVLATGSEPLIPPVKDIRTADGGLRPGVHVYRTLGDYEAIVASDAARAVVVGGGVLGLEAARGLMRRGLDVTILHAAPRLMERQLDDPSAAILRRSYARLGIEAHIDTFATGVTGADRVDGIVLADGSLVPSDLTVLACGVRPRTRLAADAGLDVGQGVMVNCGLRTSDPYIYAIGDCAQFGDELTGLVDAAWDQARVLADQLAGSGPCYRGSRPVTRLKAAGIELVAMGDVVGDDSDAEVIVFSDPRRDTYKKLVVRDDRLVGAVLLGDDDTSGTVTQFFDRGGRLPSDRKPLMFTGIRSGADASEALSEHAPVCRCNGVSKSEITRAWLAGARDFEAVTVATRACTGCGTCRGVVTSIVAALAKTSPVEVGEAAAS